MGRNIPADAVIAPCFYPALGKADARNEGEDRSAPLPLTIPHRVRSKYIYSTKTKLGGIASVNGQLRVDSVTGCLCH